MPFPKVTPGIQCIIPRKNLKALAKHLAEVVSCPEADLSEVPQILGGRRAQKDLHDDPETLKHLGQSIEISGCFLITLPLHVGQDP
jgi:DNA polymerase III delta subunit